MFCNKLYEKPPCIIHGIQMEIIHVPKRAAAISSMLVFYYGA